MKFEMKHFEAHWLGSAALLTPKIYCR